MERYREFKIENKYGGGEQRRLKGKEKKNFKINLALKNQLFFPPILLIEIYQDPDRGLHYLNSGEVEYSNYTRESASIFAFCLLVCGTQKFNTPSHFFLLNFA